MKSWFALIALFAYCRATQLLERRECHVVAKIGAGVYYNFGRRAEGQNIIQILAADVDINGRTLSCETLTQKVNLLKEWDGIWVLFGPIASFSEWQRLRGISAENIGIEVHLRCAWLDKEPQPQIINGLRVHGFYKYIEAQEFKTWVAVKDRYGAFTLVDNILMSSSRKGVQYGILRILLNEGNNSKLFTETDPSSWSVFIHGSETTVAYPTNSEFQNMKDKLMRVNIKRIPDTDSRFLDFEITVRPSEVDVTFIADMNVHPLSGSHRGQVMENVEIKMSGKIIESINTIHVFEKPTIEVDTQHYGFDKWKRMFELDEQKSIKSGSAKFVILTSHPDPNRSMHYKSMSRVTGDGKKKGLAITYVHTNTQLDFPQQEIW